MTFKRVCAVCGEEFETHLPNHFLCSDKCRKIRKRQVKRLWYHSQKAPSLNSSNSYSVCVICGKKFKPDYFGQKYCSAKCHANPAAARLRLFFSKIFNKLDLDCV